MSRRAALASLLLALACVVGGLAWWFVLTQRRPAPPPARLLVPIEPAHVTRIRVRRANQLVIATRGGSGGRWRLQAPVRAAADPIHIKAILSILGRRARPIDGPPGSAPPGSTALVVRFNQAPPIRLIAPARSGGRWQVDTAHGRYRLALPALDGLNWRGSDWVSHMLVPPGRRIVRLVLPHATLVRRAHGWRIEPQTAMPKARAQAVAAAWRHARAAQVERVDPNRLRRARVTLYFAKGRPRHLDIVARRPLLILRDPALDLAFRMEGAGTARALGVAPGD